MVSQSRASNKAPATGPDTGQADPELARLTLGAMNALGDATALFEGRSINVFGGIPGEEVVARIVRYEGRRHRYVSGVVTEVLTASPHRVAAPCVYFGPCTGCQWQHIDYAYQLRLKREVVEEQLSHYPELQAVPVPDTVSSPQSFNYRNHARFTVRKQGSLGYINRLTRTFVKVDKCMLMHPRINEALEALQGRCEETSQLSMRYGVNTGEWLVQPTLQNAGVPMATGQTHYREKLNGHPFRIASPSFFQVNTQQAERLAELVASLLELEGDELLLDAYAGVGTFAVLLAPLVRRVIAIEESVAAVRDAKVNTEGIDNLDFVEGKTEAVLGTLGETPDAAILDPPRVGCDPETLKALVRRRPKRIVYVSCEPETMARDVNTLVQGGFVADSAQPIDMFPQTHHVECVVALRDPR